MPNYLLREFTMSLQQRRKRHTCWFCKEVYESKRDMSIHLHIHLDNDNPIKIFSMRKVQSVSSSVDVLQHKDRDCTNSKSQSPPINWQAFPTPPTSPEMFEDVSALERSAKLYNDLLWAELQHPETEPSEFEESESLRSLGNENIKDTAISPPCRNISAEESLSSTKQAESEVIGKPASDSNIEDCRALTQQKQSQNSNLNMREDQQVIEKSNFESKVHNKCTDSLKSTDGISLDRTVKSPAETSKSRLYNNISPSQTTPKAMYINNGKDGILLSQNKSKTLDDSIWNSYVLANGLDSSESEKTKESKRSFDESDTISSSKRRCFGVDKVPDEAILQNSSVTELTHDTHENIEEDSVKTMFPDLPQVESLQSQCNVSSRYICPAAKPTSVGTSYIGNHIEATGINCSNGVLDDNPLLDSVDWNETMEATANLMLTLNN